MFLQTIFCVSFHSLKQGTNSFYEKIQCLLNYLSKSFEPSEKKLILFYFKILTLLYITIFGIIQIYDFYFSSLQKKKKLVNSIFKFTLYTALSINLFLIYRNQKNLFKRDVYFYEKDRWIKPTLKMPLSIKKHYLLEISAYLFQILLLLIEINTKDFLIMGFHHTCTLFLLFYSFKYNEYIYGIAIMMLHDTADPFLQLARTFLRLNRKRYANYSLLCFFILFGVSRLIIFPHKVLSPFSEIVSEGPRNFLRTSTRSNEILSERSVYLGFVYSMLGLFLCNLIWFHYLWKLVYRVFVLERAPIDITDPD